MEAVEGFFDTVTLATVLVWHGPGGEPSERGGDRNGNFPPVRPSLAKVTSPSRETDAPAEATEGSTLPVGCSPNLPGLRIGRKPVYTSKTNLNSKVLDFVQFGGPKCTVGGTIFEMWLGAL